MHSIHFEQVALDRWQLKPDVVHEAGGAAIYFVLEGSCALNFADDLVLRLSAGDLGIVPSEVPHRVAALAVREVSGCPGAELLAFHFLASGDSVTLTRCGPFQLRSGSSHAAAWLRRLAPLLAAASPDQLSTAAYRHLAEAIFCQALDDVDAAQEPNAPVLTQFHHL